jgi:hypothetical protein
VPIPSNREARVLTAKSYAERIAPHEEIGGVGLHDLTLAYGVDCIIDG